jgi:peptidoglycan/LPS O-acetylase OafA/YrhL
LRAAAVEAVLLYHGDVSWARGGYLGVDAFFVLSGFLITSLLLAEWRATNAIDLLHF